MQPTPQCTAWARACSTALVCLAVLLAPQGAAADVFVELSGARSLAMGGAHRGLGNSNESVWLNPAGMALTRRYSIDVQYNYGGADRLSHANASVVDSKSSPLAAGLSYTRDWGNPSGVNPTINRTHAGMAYGFNQVFAVGATGHNVSGEFNLDGKREKFTDWSATAGVAASLGQTVGLGVVWHNLFDAKNDRLLPPSVGFGGSLQVQQLSLAADLELNLRPDIKKNLAYHAGAELFLMQLVAVRGGWRLGGSDPARTGTRSQYVSGGIGLINAAYGMNYSVERSLQHEPRWSMLGSFQIFL
jgi:hypothetical protein